jgi:hypothetical protein
MTTKEEAAPAVALINLFKAKPKEAVEKKTSDMPEEYASAAKAG